MKIEIIASQNHFAPARCKFDGCQRPQMEGRTRCELHGNMSHLALYVPEEGKPEEELNVNRLAWYSTCGDNDLLSMTVDNDFRDLDPCTRTTVLCDPRMSREQRACDLERIARMIRESDAFAVADPFSADLCWIAA